MANENKTKQSKMEVIRLLFAYNINLMTSENYECNSATNTVNNISNRANV